MKVKQILNLVKKFKEENQVVNKKKSKLQENSQT
jgi:hypothetical protein